MKAIIVNIKGGGKVSLPHSDQIIETLATIIDQRVFPVKNPIKHATLFNDDGIYARIIASEIQAFYCIDLDDQPDARIAKAVTEAVKPPKESWEE